MKKEQKGQEKHFDVLIIGSGLSGLLLALSLAKETPTSKIALMTKAKLNESNSFYAQGGIAISQNEKSSLDSHIKDTLKAGDKHCFLPAVKAIIEESPHVLEALIDLDVPFHQDEKGHFSLGIEGGHSHRRIYHIGDKTGQVIVETLLEKIKRQENIHCFSNHIAINLISKKKAFSPKCAKTVLGAYVFDEKKDTIHTFLAKATVLATGGSGKIYRYTSNPDVATGDGVAMASRAGAQISHMEFYQFHPTLLYHPDLNNFLISEALRGEGARLLNGDTFKPFMANYAPKLQELATRDVVSRAIFCEIEDSKANHVWLDITHHPKAFLEKRFPKIYQTLLNIGIDISQSLIPVVPAAHYQCGGIVTTTAGETSLNQLFAIGEVAATGLHGANRLASNSLLEAAAMGLKAKTKILPLLKNPLNLDTIRPWQAGNVVNPRRASQISAHWKGLRSEMSSYAGIVRTEAGLKDVLTLVQTRKKIIEDYYWQHRITRDLIELRNIILVAEHIIKAALKRKTSSGGHFREDA